jgi:hypothetical protein
LVERQGIRNDKRFWIWRLLVKRINICKRIIDGLNGGVGIFEGDPYKMTVGDPANPTFTLKDFDFTQSMTVIGKEEIICALKKKKHGEDWLNDVADGFSMAFI